MTTVNDIILDARAILDEYTDDGALIPSTDMPDLIASAIRFADMGQKELYKIGRVQKTIEIICSPVENKLTNGFQVTEYTGTEQYYPNENGLANIKSYCVQADATHTIIIQELHNGIWQDLITHSETTTTTTQYKGNITTSNPQNYVRIKFSGNTYYRHVNRALFEYRFNSDSAVPDYAAWVQVTMPSDFKSIDMVVEEYPDNKYDYSSSYKFEQPNRLFYPYEYKGVIKIIYKPVPVTLITVNDVLQIDDIVAKALSFYVASWLSPYSNQSLTNPLFQKYLELKNDNTIADPMSEENITDIYGGW